MRGTVTLPGELKAGRRNPGYWRVDNGNVPVQPPPFRAETVVLVEGLKGAAPAAKTVTVELAALQATPPLVVLGPGSVVEIKNSGKVAHDLGIAEPAGLMPVERLTPGNVRRQRFNEPGGFVIRCAEYPHLAISVVVVSTPFFALAEDKGAFKIADVPDGNGELKVWSHGRWMHAETVAVTNGKSPELSIKLKAGAQETSE